MYFGFHDVWGNPSGSPNFEGNRIPGPVAWASKSTFVRYIHHPLEAVGNHDEMLDNIKLWQGGRPIGVLACLSGNTAGEANAALQDSRFRNMVSDLSWHIAVTKQLPLYGIEVWNEPNGSGYGSLPPQTVAQLCGQAKAGIRPGWTTPVISGGVFAGSTEVFSDWRVYFTQLMQQLPVGVEVAIHPYATGTEQFANAQAKFDQAKARAGGRLMWVTEAGFSSTRLVNGFQCTNANQDQRGSVLYHYVRNAGARAFVWFRMQDVRSDPRHDTYQERYEGYGAFTQGLGDDTQSGDDKPIWTTLSNMPR